MALFYLQYKNNLVFYTMPAKLILDDKILQEIKELYLSGINPPEISKKYCLSEKIKQQKKYGNMIKIRLT